jgi:nitroreductase
MDAYQAIIGKRDTRRFLDEPVAGDLLARVLQAGRMAGSAKNSQLNRVVVVTESEGRRQMAGCGDFTAWIHEAPVVLVLVVPVEGGRLFDVGRMAQNMMVAAHASGLGSCPVTFQHQDRVRAALGLPADMEGPMGVILGHPGPPDDRRLPAPRIPLEELVHRERWQG